MNYKILGDSDCPLAEIRLNRGETVKIENGSMAYMAGVEISGRMNSHKSGLSGVLGAIGRSMTSGESMFITEASAVEDDAVLGIAPAVSGKITRLSVGQKQYRLNTGAFLACDPSVSYVMKKQSIGKALFGGTGGLFVMETQGEGDILINAYGDLISVDVTPERPVTIDNEHVVAWDADLDYSIQVASGLFGFTTGEGLVNEFTGNGQVLIQTRNIRSLAETLIPYLPDKSSD